ncbi:unnamed protein product [Meganyctiphanes norvegica]|uniref:Metalloendopeptidase n=1 Tax=Meganyctiphanes norvegica TaxID=48144 RepID=A0AAV2QNE0_MEGNR
MVDGALDLFIVKMFVCKVVPIILAALLTVVKTNEEDIPNVTIGEPNDPSSDVVGQPISEAELEAALADESLTTNQLEDSSPITQQGSFFQGDIQIQTKDQLIEIMQKHETDGQSSAISNPRMKWAKAQVPYFLSSSFSRGERAVIARAMAEYRQQTCIRFIPRTTHRDYIHILKGEGCSSMVGSVGGAQTVSLGRGCVHYGIVLHELMHALGFWHEQSRFDRDDHVNINWSNVITNMEYNFKKKTRSVSQDLGLAYDYASVMHYDQYAFARNQKVLTITPKKRGAQIYGTDRGFSELDKKSLNLLYECSGTTQPKPTKSGCVDKGQRCAARAKLGQCRSNTQLTIWMHNNCKKSCNKC